MGREGKWQVRDEGRGKREEVKSAPNENTS